MGPNWLKLNYEEWPVPDLKNYIIEEPIEKVTAVDNTGKIDKWYYNYFSTFQKIVRLIAWIRRFFSNCKKLKCDRLTGCLTVQEILDAEKQIIKLIQEEWYEGEKSKEISSLNAFYDQDGIIRVKSKIILREDSENFKYPIVLPDKHPVVKMLIMDHHKKLKHAGVQTTLTGLREYYWITKGRRTIRNIINKCLVCKRHAVKGTEAKSCPLPLDRVRDSRIFEITGLDFAGPLYLKGKIKVWICIFTCAVYRAVHLELVSSLSVASFIQTLRRFIARRGRPLKIYSDNGTNFTGTVNMLSSIDWQQIQEFSTAQKIEWRFNIPASAWWGGFWERLIRIMKDLLKRVLGKACVTYEEMSTILYECEAVINSRPITYVMDGDPSVSPLTPSMFLHDINEIGVPDFDKIDSENINKRLRYLHKLRTHLRQRFRNEYLGFLMQKSNLKNSANLKIGEIVLVGSDNFKRLDWPLAKIIEIFPGKDNVCRVVKLRTCKGEITRPIQKIYRLEICAENMENEDGKIGKEDGNDSSQEDMSNTKNKEKED